MSLGFFILSYVMFFVQVFKYIYIAFLYTAYCTVYTFCYQYYIYVCYDKYIQYNIGIVFYIFDINISQN